MSRKPTGVDVRHNTDGTTSYRIRWRDGGGRDGQQLSHTFRTRTEAIDALRSIEIAGWRCHCPRHCPADAEPGRYGARGATPELTWGRYARRRVANLTGVGEGYRAQFAADLDRHCGPLLELPFEQVTRDAVGEWVRSLERKGLSATTIGRLAVQAGSVQRAAIDAGLAVGNPFALVRIGRRDHDAREEMVALTHAEWARLERALPEGVYRDLGTTLVGTGLRFGEATALAVGAVDLPAVPPRLHVGRAWKSDGRNGWILGPPKSARSRRTISFSSAVAAALERQTHGKDPGALVFITPAGTPIRPANFHNRVWRPACDAAGLARRPRVHDLRHTHASWLIAAGRPITGISRRLGHESVQTTDRIYAHLLPGVDEADVEALEAIMPVEPEDDGEG